MNPALKYQIIEKIVQTTDEALLQEIKSLLESPSGDWWNTISEAERVAIDEGLAQADRGEVIPHEQAWGQLLAIRKKRT
jgi:hypothetical protein